ncbi:unnamed protein product [Allacma fusca]|uniref:2-phosphoxylose phosphatase 1 n=1 Tax=Allacma fusca TaxID=39272 RepID=A0A8J2L212_9HEXA|nr:unnamed protein product [Allacma fusca]
MWLISLGFGFGKTRAVRCYVTLLIWIIIVSLGLYWLLTGNGKSEIWSREQHQHRWEPKEVYGPEEQITEKKLTVKEVKSSRKKIWDDTKEFDGYLHSSISRLCNPPEEIAVEDENLQITDMKLDAVVIIFRHGDRGPLSHVGSRNLSLINCSSDHPDFQKFYRFSADSMTKLTGYTQFIGPFHSFQKVPTTSQCHLGQLSQLGSWQLIQLGKAIQSAYQSSLFNSPTPSNHGSSLSVASVFSNSSYSVPVGSVNPMQNIKVVAYSTRYRRTLQSLMAFLYGLLGPKLIIPNVTVRESQSINFCFNDCSCRATERLKKLASKKFRPSSAEKATMISLVNQINAIIGLEKTKKSGTSLLDLLLVYSCHKTDFPCRSKSLIRKVHSGSVSDECITHEDVSSLVYLLQKESQQQRKIQANRQLYLLTSYGLLKEIVNLALKMTSSSHPQTSSDNSWSSPFANAGVGPRTKLAIFSGHDTTLQSLTGALGIFTGHPDIHLVPYASRLIFEFYRKTNVPPNSARKHFLRVVYNGQAVTHLVRFCDDGSSKNPDNRSQGTPTRNILCPLENLVRFLHDHYFESFSNATNYKDACQKKGKKRK